MKIGKFAPLLLILFFIAINGLAWVGFLKGFWPQNYALYFYWGESVAIGMFALFIYAKHLLIFFFVLAVAVALLGVKNFTGMGDLKIPMTFWGLYSLCWLIYFEIRRSFIGHRIRLQAPLYQLFYYLAFMALAIAGACATTGYVYLGQFYVPSLQDNILNNFQEMAIAIPTITITILRVVDMIGERHALYFLLGTYHRPAEKKRIVMFIDMVGSSAAAEKLEPRKSMEMIARFIFDAGVACRTNGGDIVNYTGDGLMVLWPLTQADRVLRAYETLVNRLAANRKAYDRQFGIVPDFRMGIHAGDVVISQIGNEKLFLGVYGDVVNTASRIEQANKEHGTRILLSRAVKQQVSLGLQKRIKAMGAAEVRGKEDHVDIYTLV